MPNHRLGLETEVEVDYDDTKGRHRADSPAETVRTWLASWEGALLTGAVVVTLVIAVVSFNIIFTSGGEEPGPPIAAGSPSPDVEETVLPEVSPSEEASPSPSASPRVNPVPQLQTLTNSLNQQIQARRLEKKTGRDLIRQVQVVIRQLNDGQVSAAAQSFASFRNSVEQARSAGNLDSAGYAALPNLASIAETIDAAAG